MIEKLLTDSYPNYSIYKRYAGVLGGENIYAFVIHGDDNKFVIIYEDKTIVEITEPTIIQSVIDFLEEV